MFSTGIRQLQKRLLSTASNSSNASSLKTADIFIVGGGPAGLSLATAIKSSSVLDKFKTVLVDAGKLSEKVAPFYTNPPSEYHNRVVSLTPRSKDFLTKKLGVSLLEDRIQPYDGLYVTEGSSHARLSIERQSMLYMIEILNIQSSLMHHLKQMNLPESSFSLKEDVKVTNIEYSRPEDPHSWPIVTLSNGDRYETRLLVGADGFNSPVKKFSGIHQQLWWYNTFGLVATLKLASAPSSSSNPTHKLKGWQRFLKWGPIAHLPLPGDNASLVWSTSGNELSKLLLAADPKVFAALINAAFILDEADLEYYFKALANQSGSSTEAPTNEELLADIKGRIEDVWNTLGDDSQIESCYPPQVVDIVPDTRARFPLKFSHADTYIAERIALVGDAAHTTHPLAGQGLNMGQHDVEQLTKALEHGALRGLDIGSKLCLEPYWGFSYGFNATRLGMADILHKLYGTDAWPVVQLRSLGLDITNNLGFLKNTIGDILSGKE